MKKVLVSILMSLFLISLASAWIIPDTHNFIGHKALELAPNSPYGKIVAEHFDDFSACMSATDYSVFFCFQQGFSTIGKVYLASHNNNICDRAIELANKNDPAELSCAIGICSMEFMDSPSHNGFVPMVIERSRVGVNGLLHAPAEQCINEKVSTQELITEGRSALVNKYPVHRQFLINVFQSDSRATTIDVGQMMDAFVAEVAQSDEYTVGFRGFFAIPTSIHIILALFFLLNLLGLALLIKKKNKGKINKITMVLCFFLILFVILVYVLFFTGNLWKVFQTVNHPMCSILPISGYETYLQQAIDNEVNLFNNGAMAVYQLPDPSGRQALHDADQKNKPFFYTIIAMLIILSLFLVWVNFRRKK